MLIRLLLAGVLLAVLVVVVAVLFEESSSTPGYPANPDACLFIDQCEGEYHA